MLLQSWTFQSRCGFIVPATDQKQRKSHKSNGFNPGVGSLFLRPSCLASLNRLLCSFNPGVGSLFLRQPSLFAANSVLIVSIPVWVHCSCDTCKRTTTARVIRFNPGVGSLFLRRLMRGIEKIGGYEFQSRCGFIVPATRHRRVPRRRSVGFNPGVGSLFLRPHSSCSAARRQRFNPGVGSLFLRQHP